MIISASRRTDIPAFYFDWFCHRLHAGFVDVINPFNRKQVSRISLKSDVVDCIVFWTKDPAPMLSKLQELSDYSYYVQISITPYDKDIETNLRPKEEIIKTAQKLSLILGKERVVWRYDPILLNENFTIERHLEWFEKTLIKLSNYVERCVISFIDIYAKMKNNNLYLNELSVNEINELAGGLSQIAKGSGISLQTCSEEIDIDRYGISHGACIDKELIERIIRRSLNLSKAKNQRPLCKCVESFDIGAYDTCIHGCRYCYANASVEKARRGYDAHDKSSSILTGRLVGDEKITIHCLSSTPAESFH